MTDPTPRSRHGFDPATAFELADLLKELSENKETRRDIARAIKKAKGDSPHAAAFKDVEIEDKFEELKQKQEEDSLRREGERLVAEMNAKRKRLLDGDDAGRKYSEDDIKKIEDLMQKKGIRDYDDGATLYAATLPPSDPKPGKDELPQHGATWEFPRWDEFGKDPVKASRNEAHRVIGEFMRKRG
jgi:hypothetical protein